MSMESYGVKHYGLSTKCYALIKEELDAVERLREKFGYEESAFGEFVRYEQDIDYLAGVYGDDAPDYALLNKLLSAELEDLVPYSTDEGLHPGLRRLVTDRLEGTEDEELRDLVTGFFKAVGTDDEDMPLAYHELFLKRLDAIIAKMDEKLGIPIYPYASDPEVSYEVRWGVAISDLFVNSPAYDALIEKVDGEAAVYSDEWTEYG
jgi:hypothetical protein